MYGAGIEDWRYFVLACMNSESVFLKGSFVKNIYKNVGQNWYIYNFLVRHLEFWKSDDKFTFSDHGNPNIIILTEIAKYIFFGSAIFDPPSWIFWNLTSDSCSADPKAYNDQHSPCKMNTWESYPQSNCSKTLNAFISKRHFSNWWDISRLQF